MSVTRRVALKGILGSSVFLLGAAPEPDLELRDITVEGTLSRRFTMLLPRVSDPRPGSVPLVVLLHGLGDAAAEKLGAYAWVERYGLISSYERMRRLPVTPTSERGDMTKERAEEITHELTARPLRPMAFACPYLPAVQRGPELDEIARWLVDVVIPRARAESPLVAQDDAHTALDGCSMGGFHAIETFIRRPERFAVLGGVQAAITEGTAPAYADRVAAACARVGARPIRVVTSTLDPFRRGNEVFAHELTRRGVRCELRVIPGPHDQPWLREAGTIEMLLWHNAHPS